MKQIIIFSLFVFLVFTSYSQEIKVNEIDSCIKIGMRKNRVAIKVITQKEYKFYSFYKNTTKLFRIHILDRVSNDTSYNYFFKDGALIRVDILLRKNRGIGTILYYFKNTLIKKNSERMPKIEEEYFLTVSKELLEEASKLAKP
jgi:hypothetical protein